MTTLSVPSPEEFISNFPEETLPKISGLPTYETLTELRKALKYNASSVPSTLGGGNNGYLGIVVSTAVYASIDPTPFITPVDPGVQPNIPVGTTAAATAVIVRAHQEHQRQFREHQNLQRALKKQLQVSVEPLYLRAIRDSNAGFNNITIYDMLRHLFDSYGQITPLDIKDNYDRMYTPWNPSTPFEMLIDQIDEAQEFADAGNQAFSAAQILNCAYTLVFNTGLFFDDCKAWNNKQDADKTWTNFKKHFAEAHRTLKLQQRTSQQAGFHGANAAYGSFQPTPTSKFLDDTTEALANLATASAADRQAFTTLTNTIADLTKQLKAKDDEISKLKSINSAQYPRRQRNNNNYCWTHGFLVGKKHTSESCNTPAAGHQKDATARDNKGGSQAGKNN